MLNFRFLGHIVCLIAILSLPPVKKNTLSDKEAMDRFIRWEENSKTHTPTSGTRYPETRREKPRAVALRIPKNRNVFRKNEPVLQQTLNGMNIETCTPGKQIPQNEVTGDVNPQNPKNIVVGANDYRFVNADTLRYDGSGGVYTTLNGGKKWKIGILPNLVLGNQEAPGKYHATGDPSISAGPDNVFWYSNVVLDRVNGAGGVAVSRSMDQGLTWETNFVIETGPPPDHGVLGDDKEWIGADPSNPDVAYVMWTQFHTGTPFAPIVYSRTTDGGKTWTKAKRISSEDTNQGSYIVVDEEGTAHAIWLAYTNKFAAVAYTAKRGAHFSKSRVLSKVDEIRSPIAWSNFFTNSFPALAVDGAMLHIVWTNWNGTNADIVYMRSTDRGLTWSAPVTIDSNPDDQFLPRVSARNGIVAVGYLDHYKDPGSTYHASMVYSNNGGDTWFRPVKVSKKRSDPEEGNRFGFPSCDARFIGDYNGITVDSRGRAHIFWTDIRKGNSPNDGGDARDQDPYMATVAVPK